MMLRRKMRVLATTLLGVFGVMIAVDAFSGAESSPSVASDVALTDWSIVRIPDGPNSWLVGPTGFKGPPLDQEAPIFSANPVALAAAWKAVVSSYPRSQILLESEDKLALEAQQTSRWFGFNDRISSCIEAVGPGRSTITVLSRSSVGYWDLGVNRRRVQSWLKDLSDRVTRISQERLVNNEVRRSLRFANTNCHSARGS